jgi:hypothetical protein
MSKTKVFKIMGTVVVVGLFGACAHQNVESVTPEQAVRIDRKLVREAVTFGPGAADGAVIPEVSSPCLHAEMVTEHKEAGGRVWVEKVRKWTLQCDAQILGVPSSKRSK